MRLATCLALVLALAACSSEQSSSSDSLTRAVGACGSIEAHVIGAYDPGGDVTVQILRPGKQVLVLSAHTATTWHVTTGTQTELLHVYAVGYARQTVEAPAGVDVMTDSADTSGTYANGYEWPSSDAKHLLELAAIRTHHEVTSFHGCKAGTKWTIHGDMAVTSNCDVTNGDEQYDAVTDCAVTGGSGTCGSGSGSGSGSGGEGGSGSGSGSGSGGGIY